MLSAHDVPPALVEHALLLLARQQGGTPPVARRAQEELARWRAEAELHEQAFQIARQAWAKTDATELQGHIALPRSEVGCKTRHMRRGVVTALGVAGLLAAGRWLWPALVSTQTFKTGRGQILGETLADESRVDLGALTTLRVRFGDDTRHVWLDDGEARFSVSKDVHRPFLVDTKWGRVQVLGTEFSVSLTENAMQVEVAEGLVSVRPTQNSGNARTQGADVQLRRGDAILVGSAGLGRLSRVDPANVGAWRDGWLVFDETDLLSAIDHWNDYTNEPIRVKEQDRAALQRLHITGSFSINNGEALLSSLPRILPVRVVREGGRAWVQAR